MPNTRDTISGLVSDLRAAADWLEDNAEAAPDIYIHRGASMLASFRASTEAELVEVTRWFAKGAALDHPVRKGANDEMGWIEVHRDFGPLYLWGYGEREQVCERVVTGTETVTIPDPDFEIPMVTVERETVEWRCNPVLADRRATLDENLAGVAAAKAVLRPDAFAEGEQWVDQPDMTCDHGEIDARVCDQCNRPPAQAVVNTPDLIGEAFGNKFRISQ